MVGKKHVDDFSHTPKRLRKHGVLCFGDQKLKSNQIIILRTKRSWKNKSIQEEFQSVLKRVCFQNGGGLAGGHGSIVQITHTRGTFKPEFCFKVYSLGFFELTLACKKRELNLMAAEKSSKSTNSLFENKQVQNSWMPGFRNKNCWKNMHSFFEGPKTLRHARLRFLSIFFEGYAKKKKHVKTLILYIWAFWALRKMNACFSSNFYF